MCGGLNTCDPVSIDRWPARQLPRYYAPAISIDDASANGQIYILDWWLRVSKNAGIALTYTPAAVDRASVADKTDVLDWWLNSGLVMMFTKSTIDDLVERQTPAGIWWMSSGRRYCRPICCDVPSMVL